MPPVARETRLWRLLPMGGARGGGHQRVASRARARREMHRARGSRPVMFDLSNVSGRPRRPRANAPLFCATTCLPHFPNACFLVPPPPSTLRLTKSGHVASFCPQCPALRPDPSGGAKSGLRTAWPKSPARSSGTGFMHRWTSCFFLGPVENGLGPLRLARRRKLALSKQLA